MESLRSKKEEPKSEFFNVADFRKQIEETYLEETEGRQRRINLIKREVGVRLKEGLPVQITREMMDLGIAEEISAVLMKAEFAMRLQRMSMDADDEEPRRKLPVSF